MRGRVFLPALASAAAHLFDQADDAIVLGPLTLLSLAALVFCLASAAPGGRVTLAELREWKVKLEAIIATVVERNAPPGAALFRRALHKVITAGAQGAPVYVEDVEPLIAEAEYLGQWRLERYGVDILADKRQPWVDFLTRWCAGLGDPPLSLGHRLRLAREAVGWTQQQLADKLLVDRTAVLRWEHDERVPTARHRIGLAQALGGQPSDYTGDAALTRDTGG